jgi:hypothetical protein
MALIARRHHDIPQVAPGTSLRQYAFDQLRVCGAVEGCVDLRIELFETID